MAPAETPLAGRTATGALWVSAQTWGNQIVRFVVFLALARILGPETFGLLALALLVTVMGEALIVEGGWSQTLIRNPHLQPSDCNGVFWLVLMVSLTFLLLAIAIAGPVADWFDEPELADILPWLACTLPLHALSVVPRALLQRAFAFRPLAIASFTGTTVGAASGLVLALLGAGIWSLVVYNLAQVLCRSVLFWWLAAWRPGFAIDASGLRLNTRFVGGAMVDRLSRSIDFILGRALVGAQAGTVALGFFGFATEFLNLIYRLLVFPMTRVALPAIASLQDAPERLHRAMLQGTRYLALIAIPAPIGIAIVAADLVPLLVGPQWMPAVPAIQIAMLLAPVQPLARLAVTLMLALGRSGIVAGLALTSTGLFLLLLLLSVLLFGRVTVEMVLTVMAARAYLMLPIHVVWIRRVTTIRPLDLMKALGPLVLAGAVMAGTLLLVRDGLLTDVAAIWRLALTVPLGVLVYGATLALVARPLLSEVLGLLASASGRRLPTTWRGPA